jgi:hypothetical protein
VGIHLNVAKLGKHFPNSFNSKWQDNYHREIDCLKQRFPLRNAIYLGQRNLQSRAVKVVSVEGIKCVDSIVSVFNTHIRVILQYLHTLDRSMNLENLLQFFFREIMWKIPHTNNLELNMLKTKEKKITHKIL